MKKSVLKENLFVVVVVVFCLFGGGGVAQDDFLKLLYGKQNIKN